MNGIDLTGRTFGRLFVIKRHEYRDAQKNVLWECLCECGGTKMASTGSLVHGGVKSCCRFGTKTMDWQNNRLARIWYNMIKRCTNKRNVGYINYGARGISVCQEWGNFEAFKKWALDNGYNDTLTIDRVDGGGNYEPSNCRWATYTDQANNRRGNVTLSLNGETKTISQWAIEYKISPSRIRRRIVCLKWSEEKAITTPIIKNKINNRYKKCQ